MVGTGNKKALEFKNGLNGDKRVQKSSPVWGDEAVKHISGDREKMANRLARGGGGRGGGVEWRPSNSTPEIPPETSASHCIDFLSRCVCST